MGRHRAEPLPERKPSWLKVKAPGGAELPAAQAADARARPPHGLRGSALPERRRVLGARHRHVHDPGRRLHPELRATAPSPTDGRRSTTSTEPERVAKPRSRRCSCSTSCITSVDRDDLPDFGACIFAETIRQIHDAHARDARSRCSSPISRATRTAIRDRARGAARDLQPQHRDGAAAVQEVPARRPVRARDGDLPHREAPRAATSPPRRASSSAWARRTRKSSRSCSDLREVDVDILTLGQYLRPSDDHIPLDRYVTPEEFRQLRTRSAWRWASGTSRAGPLVRSSYHAWEQVQAAGV